MRELITVQVGQCGSYIGQEVRMIEALQSQISLSALVIETFGFRTNTILSRAPLLWHPASIWSYLPSHFGRQLPSLIFA